MTLRALDLAILHIFERGNAHSEGLFPYFRFFLLFSFDFKIHHVPLALSVLLSPKEGSFLVLFYHEFYFFPVLSPVKVQLRHNAELISELGRVGFCLNVVGNVQVCI